MKLLELDILHGRKSKRFPIFTIDRKDTFVATGSINGELLIRQDGKNTTYKDHSGAVLIVKFDSNSDFLTTGSDDKTIAIYKKDFSNYKLFKKINSCHESDISGLLWHKNNLLSCSYDGFINIFDKNNNFSLKQKFKAMDCCRGLSLDPLQMFIACSSECDIKIYNTLYEEIKTIKNNSLVQEVFFARNSWSPDGKYLAITLVNNNVEIYNNRFEKEFTLIGHVAPCEVVAFHPSLLYNENERYMILALGSQDKSISFWSSTNPKPFLVIKNVFDQPIMDMLWCNNDLYACSYDGYVKKFEFESDELGQKINMESDKIQSDGVVFSLENKLINQIGIEQFIMKKSLDMDNFKKSLETKTAKDHFKKEKLVSLSKISLPNISNQTTVSPLNVNKNGMIKQKTMIEKLNNNNNKVNGTIKELKQTKKKIQPILIAPLVEQKNELIDLKSKNFILFKSKILSNPSIESKHIPSNFSFIINEFRIQIHTENKSKITVLVKDKEHYSLRYDRVVLFSGNKKYMVFVLMMNASSDIAIHQLETGSLVMPIITMFSIVSIDLLNNYLLILKGDSSFQVLNIAKNKSIADGFLPSNDKLLNIRLDSRYFILAQYLDNIYFYNKAIKAWLKKDFTFNSILYTNNIIYDDIEDEDETFNDLEYKFKIKEMIKDTNGMLNTCKKIVKLSLKMLTLNEIVSNKIFNMFLTLYKNGESSAVLKYLEEMNKNHHLQPFVFEMIESFKKGK